MKDKRYVFAGNRFHVLQTMLEEGLDVVAVFAIPGSFLEKALQERNISYTPIENKELFINSLQELELDIFVSNGCPYILPISTLKKPEQLYINIHPSLLPDLKGIHPINGAILFDRQPGASCHLMDDGIDSGEILAQIPLEKTDNLTQLYERSFAAEAEVFLKAYHANFQPLSPQPTIEDPIYYTRKDEDLAIDWSEDITAIIRRVKAFGIPSQGAHFTFNGKEYTTLNAEILGGKSEGHDELQIVSKTDNSLVLCKDNQLLQLSDIQEDISEIQPGDSLA